MVGTKEIHHRATENTEKSFLPPGDVGAPGPFGDFVTGLGGIGAPRGQLEEVGEQLPKGSEANM